MCIKLAHICPKTHGQKVTAELTYYPLLKLRDCSTTQNCCLKCTCARFSSGTAFSKPLAHLSITTISLDITVSLLLKNLSVSGDVDLLITKIHTDKQYEGGKYTFLK